MKKADRIIDSATGRRRRAREDSMRSLQDTAARAVVTATVSFAVGWVLKKMFEHSVAEAAQEGARSGVEEQQEAMQPVTAARGDNGTAVDGPRQCAAKTPT